jgi:DNA-binding SARP family transcriptional activator
MTDGLRITLSGRVGLGRDSELHELGGHHPPLLFALLVLERHRAVARDELCRALWGDEPPDSWTTSLRVSLSKVRAFLVQAGLAAGALHSTTAGYRLTLAANVDVDVERARAQLSAAERDCARDDLDAAGEAATAARLVLGDPLVPGASGPWIDEQRRAVAALFVRALEIESEALSVRGDHEGAVEAALRGVAAEPYRESAHRALIRAAAAAGNKAEALRLYERCRVLLADELGVDPSPATQAVHMAVLRDEPLRRAPARHTPVAAAPQPEAGAADAAAWEARGEAALWTGNHGEAISARRHAYNAYLAAGDDRSAARVALALAANHGIRSQLSVAEAWATTAARLLSALPEGPEHGFLSYVSATVLQESGRLDESREQARRAYELGRRFGVADLEALGLMLQGLVLVRQGHAPEAIPLLDEGMARATAGGLSPLATGQIYCRTIRAWLDMWEFRRAAEWIETVERCARDTGFGGYAGDCHAHLASALAARGSFADAEREAERACEECETFELSHVGLASYTLGEVHVRRGDLAAAEALFRRATEYGVEPQPGFALLQLARGDAAGAAASIRSFLASHSEPLARAPVLAATAHAAIAAVDAALVESAVAELAETASAYGSPGLAAAARRARGTTALHAGDATTALRELRAAADYYRRAEMPYELAETRVDIASARLQAGDRAGALMEQDAATALLRRLGARRGISAQSS